MNTKKALNLLPQTVIKNKKTGALATVRKVTWTGILVDDGGGITLLTFEQAELWEVA